MRICVFLACVMLVCSSNIGVRADDGSVLDGSTGTLQVSLDGPPSAPAWFYVNGRIVSTRGSKADDHTSRTLTLKVFPGSYHVDAALMTDRGTSPPAIDFPFIFTKAAPDVRVTAGHTSSVMRGGPFYTWTTGWTMHAMPLPPFAAGAQVHYWLANLVKNVQNESDNCTSHPVYKSLVAIAGALSASPPASGVVRIDFPAKYGGNREYDSRQIRQLVAWLKTYCWSDAFPINDDAQSRADAQRWGLSDSEFQTWLRVSAYVQDSTKRIASLNSIADQLDKAKSGN